MASVEELIAAAKAKQSPTISVMEGLARGYIGGQQQALERAKTLIMLEQNRREQEMMMKNQERLSAQMAAQVDADRKKELKEAGTPPEPFFPRQKIIQEWDINEKGQVSKKMKISPDEDKEGTRTFQKVDYLDEAGKTRIGSYDTRTGRILRGVDDVYAPVSKNSETDPIKKAKDLRKEFTQQSKDFFGVNESMARIRSSANDPSAAGDLSLIFNYMKVLDPGSVVRETEFATAQNAAGVPERVRAKYNQVINGERLAPDQRADFVDRAEKIFEGQRAIHSRRVDEYSRIAKSIGADPMQVIVDPLIDRRPQGPGLNQPAPDAFVESPQMGVETSRNGRLSSSGPQIGEIKKGYRFNGGNPADPSSWERVR